MSDLVWGPRWSEFNERIDRGWKIESGHDLDQHWVSAWRRSLIPAGPRVQVSVESPNADICVDAALEAMDRIDGVR